MTKNDFLFRLSALTVHLPQSERGRSGAILPK